MPEDPDPTLITNTNSKPNPNLRWVCQVLGVSWMYCASTIRPTWLRPSGCVCSGKKENDISIYFCVLSLFHFCAIYWKLMCMSLLRNKTTLFYYINEILNKVINRALPWPMLYLSTKFHGNRLCRFCMILLTVKQTNTLHPKHLAEVITEISVYLKRTTENLF